MSAPIKNCLIVGVDETLRTKVREALDAAVPTAAIFMDKSTKTAFSLAHSKLPEVVIVEWDAYAIDDITAFLQKFRRISGCLNNHVLIVANNATQPLAAVAMEYQVHQILLQTKLTLKVKSAIRDVTTELSQPGALRTRLLALEQAAQRRDRPLMMHTVQQLYKQFPESARAKVEYANFCLSERKYEQAEEIARRALVFEPGNLRAQNVLARACLHRKKTNEALSLLESSELLSPKNLDRLLMLGDTYLNQNRTDDARKKFEDALHVDEENREAMTGIAGVELKEANLNEALTLLREATSEEEVAALFNNAGILAARKGRITQARSLYETAIRSLSMDSLKARVHFNIGLAYERGRQFNQAMDEYQKSLQLDGSFQKSKRHYEAVRNAIDSGADLLRNPTEPIQSILTPDELNEFDTLVDDLNDDKLEKALRGDATPKPTSQPKATTPSITTKKEDDPLKGPSLIELATREKVLKGFPVKVIKDDEKK